MNRVMKRFLAAVVMLTAFGCNTNEVITESLPPEVLFPDGTIFTVKTLKTITITPEYRNAEGAAFVWSIDGERVADTPELTFAAGAEPTSVTATVSVTAEGGEAVERVRIDVVERVLPEITLAGAAEGFSMCVGESMLFSPSVVESLPVEYAWSVGGEVLCTEREFIYSPADEGEQRLTLAASNEDGECELSFTVTVYRSEEEKPMDWMFAATEFSTTVGRAIRIAPLFATALEGAAIEWRVDGRTVEGATTVELLFTAERDGEYAVSVVATKGGQTLSERFTVRVYPANIFYRPRTAHSSASVDRVCEYTPAPGQFIGEGAMSAVTTPAEACDFALQTLSRGGALSLGAFGGRVVVGFDHSIDRSADGSAEIAILGNSFLENNEPGVVWVMQDENGNGAPDDTWYRLRGSEDGRGVADYAVTYTRSSADVPWRDNRGGQGVVERNGFHIQTSYCPQWVASESYTLAGFLLPNNSSFEYSDKYGCEIWLSHAFAWGYADNGGEDCHDGENRLRIADAVDFRGESVTLDYIDFVMVQSGVQANRGEVENSTSAPVGELSTEVCGIKHEM